MKEKLVVLGVAAALLTYIAACAWTIIAASGIFPDTAFKGVVVGTLGGLLIAAVANALAQSAARRVASERRREVVAGGASAVALLGVSGAFALLFLLPTLGRDPRSYFGAPDSTYSVELMDGRVETRSGAVIGSDEWGFDAGIRCGMCYSIAVVAACVLGSSLLGLGRKRELPG